jgi:hypothetical protein
MGTRVAFLDFIIDWVNNPASERGLVLFGQAGMGKSLIAHEIARLFDEMHRLTPSFIFLRREQSVWKAYHLFTTLAQLDVDVPLHDSLLFVNLPQHQQKPCRSCCEGVCCCRGDNNVAFRRQAASAPTWDCPVFMLNYLMYLVDTLTPHPCAACKCAELNSAVEVRVLELIEEQVRFAPSHILSFLQTFSSWDLLV